MRTNAALPYMVMVHMAHPTSLARVVFPVHTGDKAGSRSAAVR
jgi:hypothetical protein